MIFTDGKRAKTPPILIRPLPWIFFLPALIILRYTRVIVSLISICIGFDEITATTMVSYLHQSRRNIRSIIHKAKPNVRFTFKDNSLIDCAKYALSTIIPNFKIVFLDVFGINKTIVYKPIKTSVNHTYSIPFTNRKNELIFFENEFVYTNY